MRRALAALLLMMMSMPGGAAELFDKPTSAAELKTALAAPIASMQASTRMQANFTQLKHLSGFPQPLKAAGDVRFLRGLGVIWHTAQPYDSTFLFDAKGMRQVGPAVSKTPPSPPAMRMVSDVFLALFELDLARLEATFELFSQPREGGWVLGLRPRDPAVAALADRIRVEGGAAIERIELSDTRGDRTEIRLADVVSGREPISDRDRAAFAN